MSDLSTCEFSVRFEIDGHKVSMSSATSHHPNEAGKADKGFIFGNLLVEVAGRLEDSLTPDEWQSFLLSVSQLNEDRDNRC